MNNAWITPSLRLALQAYRCVSPNGNQVGLIARVIEASSTVGMVGSTATVRLDLGSVDGSRHFAPMR